MSTEFQLWTNDGTPQNRRFPEGLDPEFFKLDDRSPEDYLRIAAAMAEKLRLDESGSWRALWPEIAAGVPDRSTILSNLENRRDNPPHLALFIAFLRLYQHAQAHLNSLNKAHLDHYYRKVLGFRPRLARPDHVSVFPSLAKGVARRRLPAGTALDAGQDAEGNPLIYLTDSEIVVTTARVASVKAIRVGNGVPWKRVVPVANSKDGLGAPFAKDELPMWPALGPSDPIVPDPEGSLGFGLAISSPLLFLKEGNRTIQLTVGISGIEWGRWKAFVSSPGGWLAVPVAPGNANLITLSVDGKMPALVAVDPKIHSGAPVSRWPVLKLYAPTDLSREECRRCSSAAVSNLAVVVDRLTSLSLSNDLGPLDGSRPFAPFGSRPVVGSTFSFDSEELRSKPIRSWTPRFEWQGKPDRFVDYSSLESATRPGPGQPESAFTFSCPASGDPGLERSLFSTAAVAGPLSVIQLRNPPSAFGHGQYASRLTEVVTTNASGMATQTKEKPFTPLPLPLEPYVPTVKSFAVGYESQQPFTIEAVQSGVFRVFHLHPFGMAPLTSAPSLLPLLPEASELFIGLADADPDSLLRLHFAVIEGSGKSVSVAPTLSWSYLSAEGWTQLDSAPAEDGTNGLLQPGIIAFEAMPGAVSNHPLMPAGLHWLRASVAGDPDAVGKLSAITAQAVRATLQLGEVVPVHLRAGSRDVLPAGSIKNLLVPDPAIAAVGQPFTSYGGREAEDEKGFYTRVSERIRHRQRAITAWDYERLVLAEFPEIYKVLCVRSGPGEVKVVVVPRSVRASWYDRLQPRPAPALRKEIEQYLRSLCSGMTRLSVIDPDYEPLQVSCRVAFVRGTSPSIGRAQLAEDLKSFLTPWAYDDSKEVVFGGRIHQSVIQAFMDGRDYVDHFTDFQLVQYRSTPDGIPAGGRATLVTEAQASQPWSILVSAQEHRIN